MGFREKMGWAMMMILISVTRPSEAGAELDERDKLIQLKGET